MTSILRARTPPTVPGFLEAIPHVSVHLVYVERLGERPLRAVDLDQRQLFLGLVWLALQGLNQTNFALRARGKVPLEGLDQEGGVKKIRIQGGRRGCRIGRA